MPCCSISLLKMPKGCLKALTNLALCLEMFKVLGFLESSSVLHLFTNLEAQFFSGCLYAIRLAELATIHSVGAEPLSHSLLICLIGVFFCPVDKNRFRRAAWDFDRL